MIAFQVAVGLRIDSVSWQVWLGQYNSRPVAVKKLKESAIQVTSLRVFAPIAIHLLLNNKSFDQWNGYFFPLLCNY